MTAFDAVHTRLDDALEAVVKLPVDLKTDVIDRLDGGVVAAIAGN